MVVLDTDLLSLLERDSGEAATLRRRLRSAEAGAVVTTIINFEEQMRGWLAVVAHARTMARQIQAYDRLHRFLENYREIPVLDFDARAAMKFQRLRKEHRRLSTNDLKIAAIAIANNATLLTRNASDFAQIPALKTEDWTA
jgi:tRNA(fMet)-specific endonuclease VapC